MVYKRRGKFGVHSSGRTLRTDLSYHSGFAKANANNFWLDVSVRCSKNLSIEDVLKKNDFQDGLKLFYRNGERETMNRILPYYPVDRTGNLFLIDLNYQGLEGVTGLSLNKKKRWLLPSLLKHHITEKANAEGTDTPTVTLVERCLLDERIVGGKADCTAVYTTGSTLGKYEKHCKHKFAQVADLRREVGLDKESPEICYEVGYPFPGNSRPHHLECKPWMKKSTKCHKGEKEKQRKKYKKNVRKFRRSLIEDTKDFVSQEFCDTEPMETDDPIEFDEGDSYTRSFEVPLTCYISCSNKQPKKGKKRKNNVTSDNGDKKKYGKGDVVYIEKPNNVELKDNKENRTSTSVNATHKPFKPLPFVDLEIQSESVCAKELIKDYKDSFQFSHTSPEKLLIDLLPSLGTSLKLNPDHFTATLLIEFLQNAVNDSSIIIARTAVLLNAMSVPLNTVTNRLCSYLEDFGSKPLTLKDIADESVSFLIKRISSDGIDRPMESIPLVPVTLPLSIIHEVCNITVEMVDPRDALKELNVVGCTVDCESCEDIHKPLAGVDDLIECGVCFTEKSDNGDDDDASFVCLKDCSHWFCNTCWKHYITEQIDQGKINITCPALKCQSHVNDAFVLSMVPNIFSNFKKWKNQKVLTMSRKYFICPGIGCQRIATAPSSNKPIPLSCLCGEVWCTQCQERAHWPAPCDTANKFNSKLKEFGLTSFQMRDVKSVFIKKCPKCKYPIEKFHGCPHMMCICGHEFCWNCHMDYYNHDYALCRKQTEKEQVEIGLNVFSGKNQEHYGEMAFDFHKASSTYLKSEYRDLASLKHNMDIYRTFRSKNIFPKSVYHYSWHESLLSTNALEVYQKALDFKYQAYFVLKNVALTLSICPNQKLKNGIQYLFESLKFTTQHVEAMLKEKKRLGDPQFISLLEHTVNIGENTIKNMRRPTVSH